MKFRMFLTLIYQSRFSVNFILKEEPWFWQMEVLSVLMSLTK